MSYPMYNPYASGSQCTSQDQYGLASGQMEETICRTITNAVPGSSLSLPGAPSRNPAGLGSRVVQQLTGGYSLPVRNGPGQSQTTLDFNLQTTFNICAREKIRYQPTGQGALFTSMQRDIYSLSTTAESTYSASSASQDPQQSRVVGGSSSFNWLPECSESSLNIHDYAAQSTNQLLPHEPVCTPQLAEKILMSYGFQKEDLYELINYPDEETTAENLPYTLQKIRMKNANRAVTQDPIPQPAVGGKDRLVSFGQPRLFHDEVPSVSHRTVEMAQYGQIRICTPNTEDETFENLLSKAQTTRMSSARNVVAAVQQVQIQSSQTVQPIIPALSSQNNADITTPKFGLFGFPPGETPITHFTSETQSRGVITQGVNFGEPILVHTESADANCAKAQSKAQERASKIAEETSQQAPQTWMQKPSLLQLTQAVQPEEPSALKPVPPPPPPPVIRTVTDVSHPILHSGINTVSPTVPSLALVETTDVQGCKRQSPVKSATFKGLPSLAEMQDYTATKPTRFSHTCSLCKTKCAQMKDWIDHQQTSLHLLNCKRLRKEYPDWDGKVTPLQSDITSKIIPSTSYHTSQGHQKKTSDGSHSRSSSHSPRRCSTSRNRKGSSSSSSRSQSPHRRRSSRRRRASTSSSSCSHSPHRRCGSRPRWATTSSSSRSHSSHRRCGSRHRRATTSSSSSSHSPHRRCGSRRRRGTSSSRSCSQSHCRSSEGQRRKLRKRTQSLHSPRSPSSLFSTRYNHSIVSRYSRRASYSEGPKGRYSKLGSPRRSSKLRSSPRTNDVRSGSPRRDLKPRLSPRKGCEQKFPPVTSRERQMSRDEKQRSRKSPNRQLSPRSDEEERSRGRSRERRRSPRKSIEQQQQLSPRRAGNKRTPVRTDERKSSPIFENKRHSPCSGNRDKLPSPKRNDGKQSTKKWDELSKVSGSRKRQLSLEESSSQQKRSCSEQTLTGHLNSGSSVPEQPHSASVFEPLISVVLAEQAKRQTSSSPHSSFTSLTKMREASASSEGTSPASALSSTSCMPEKFDQVQPNFPRTEFAHLSKPSPPTMLKLKGNFDTLSHGDVIAAMESFGKIKSLLLFKSKQEATVCFEKEEDATRLRSKKNLEIKGVPLTFVTKQDSASKARLPTSAEDQKNPSPEKPAVSHQSISGRNLVLLPIKALLSLQRTSKKSTAVKLVKKAIVLVSKGKSVSKKPLGLNVKAVGLAAKQSVKSAKGKKEAPKPEKTPIPGQKSHRKSKVDVKDPVSVLKKTLNVTVAEKNHGKGDLPKPETASKLRLKEDNDSKSVGKAMKPSEAKALQSESSENRPLSRRKVEKSAAKSLNTAPALAAQTVKAEISKANVQEFVVSPENPVKVLETIGVAATEANERTHAKEVGTEMKNVTSAELSELENTRVSELLKLDPLTEKDQKPAVKESSPPKLKDAQPPASEVGAAVNAKQMTAQCPETSVRALTQVQMSAKSNPEPTALNLKTSVKPLQTEAQAAGSSAESPVETVPAVRRGEMKTDQKDTAVTAKTQTSPVLNPPAVSPAAAKTSATIKTTAAPGKKQPAVPTCPAFDTSLTVGEKLVPECLDRLKLNTKECVRAESILLGGPFSVDSMLLLITDLPMYNSCSYNEKEVVNLLCKFGFQYAHDNIYILPQGCMAFVLMPNERSVMDLIRASTHNQLVLKQHKLCLHIVKKDILMTPLGFYKSIMELASFKVEWTNSIYIQNISPSDTIDVREALRKIGSVRNFLPLLNKAFVEFDSVYDADRLGIWCSLMKVGFAYSVERLRIPRSCRKAQPPKQPLNAQPDCDEIIAGAEIPNAKYGIPQGTAPPFWVTMTTIPYVFPTVCPWFNIPDFLTIRGKKDLSINPHPGSAYCTVMLTGLPEGNYKHKDVAKLVWRYFPKQNLQTLYYNILVLPLQRRAFVFFCDREACCSFVLDHVKKPVSVRSCTLTVHFVLQDIRPGPSEEIMYRAMMKWSNAHVPELHFLEKRLLCVEISLLNVDLIKSVMKEIAFIASFVNYLPLANRICIEMLEAGGVKQVLDKIASMEKLSTHSTWSKVGRVECLKALRKRLEESEQINLDLEASSTGGGETAKAASSAESTASKPEEEGAPTVSKLETKPVERFAAPAQVHKPVGGATDLSEKGQDTRVSAEAPNATKCEAKPAEAADPPQVYKPGDGAEEPDHGVSAGPPDVSKSKEETGGKAVHRHSLTAQIKCSEEESAPHTPPESAALSEKKAEEMSSLSVPSRPETARAHQPCKNDSAAADPATVEETQTAPPPAAAAVVSAELTAAVKTDSPAAAAADQQPTASASSPAVDASLTVGEKLGSLLRLEQMHYLREHMIMSKRSYSLYTRLLLLSNLPKYHDGCYTESDIANLLNEFGFYYKDINIYVIPQACMAFVLMPSFRCAKQVFMASKNSSLTLNGSKLSARITTSNIFMGPFEFYKSLMDLVGFPVADDGTSTVYIQNISPAEVRDLRETLTKIDCVKNFLPLLNKVFIEFESVRDADRIGVWYSLLKRCPAHKIYRMKLPRHTSTSLPPRLASKAMPDSKDVAAGPVVPATSVGVPLGSTPPFSVTMTTTPFIFPTASPWFIIPNFSTIKTKRDLWTPASKGPKSSTIMLTRLPEGNYKHEDIAKLVWSYFRKQNLQTLLYNIVVLPLQRRAFVHFVDWPSCCNFVGDFLKSPASIKDCTLYLHQVLQEMPSGFSEDIMYRNMMKWSNAHVPELESLEERLLIVVVSEISVCLIINILKVVTSIAPIVSFLPLANRVCIEMVDSSGVTQVVENNLHASNLEIWTNVQCVESAKSLKRRINDCTKLKINLEEDNKDIWTKTQAVNSGPQLPPADVADKNTQPGLQGSGEMSDITVAGKEVDLATKTNQASKENVSEAEIKIVEKTDKNEAGKKIVPSKSTALEKQVCISVQVQESAKTTQRGIETVPEKKQEAQTVKDNIQPHVSKNAKTSELKDTRKTDQIEAKGSAEAKEEVKPSRNQLLTQTVKTAPHKPVTDPAQGAQATLKTQKPPPEVQKDKKPNPDPSSAKRDASQKPQPTAGASAAVALRSASKVKVPDAGNSCLTPGDQIENHLNATTEFHWVSVDASSSAFLSLDAILVILNLPAFCDGCYTEADVIGLLQNLGVHCEEDKIFIVPQSLIAFVFSPNMKEVQELMLAKKDVLFKDSKLLFGVIEENKPSNLFRVYNFLMSFTTFKSCYPQRVVYIQDISVNEARSLRTEMRRVGSMINYLPLLNKVFIEFQSMCDCDRVGVWHSFLKHRRSHTVYRLGVPEAFATPKPPRLPALALPNNLFIVAKAGVPKENAVPFGSAAPFWVTMTTKPFVFPTASPWFNIPAYWQHSSMENIRKCMLEGFMRPTIMLTGLPREAYTHEDVAALVWKYLPAHSLHTLLYNVMVLPLQRRAFVCFSGWEACSRFFQDHLTKPIVFKGSTCYAYLVRENIHPADDEESLYKTLMKWSNTHVPEPTGLEERLLCVGVSGMDQHTAMAVMEEVANIDTFTNFLPLADRIYIEMTTSSGVTKVVENMLSKLGKKREDWKKVGRIESVKSRKKRLTDCKTIPVKLELATGHTEPTAVKSEEHRGFPCCKETRTPGSAEPSASAAGSSAAATREKRAAEKTTRSTVTDVKTADETGDDSTTGCALRPRTPVQPREGNLELPKMDLDSFNVVKALLTQFRLQRENSRESQEVSSKCSSSSSAGPKDERNRETESPRKRSERQSSSSDALPAARRTSVPSSKNFKSSPPSKSPKRRFSPHATSSSKPSSSARGQGTSTSSSSDPVRTKGASSSAGRSHLSSGGLKRTSETCQPQKNILGPGKCAGDKSAEGKPTADEQNVELPGKNQSTETDCTDKTRSKTEESHEDEVGQSKEENHLNLNSLGGKAGEETEKEQKQDIGFKGLLGPEMSPSLDQGGLEAKTRSEAETNAAVQEEGEVSVTEENRQVKGLTVKPDKRTSVSIPAEKENPPVRREGSDKQSETETKDRGRAEERVSEGGVQDDSSTGSKPDETTRSKAATNEPPIATRSTRRGRTMTSNEANEDETPTRRTGTPSRDLQEQKKQETLKTEEQTTPEGPPATTCEQQPSQESSDDVGLRETEEQEEGAATKRPRGRPRKTAELTPVRKSVRGRNSECPDGQTAKECKEERKDDVKVPSKRRMELCGPESKRPCVSADVKLPPFDPKTPLGKEFVRRKWGNFCNLCSVAFLDQSAEDQHCRTQMHYDNLQKYHQKCLNLKPSRILKQK